MIAAHTRSAIIRRTPMKKIECVDVSQYLFDIHRDLSVSTRARKPGLPDRIDGVTVGVVRMEHDAPHGGEVHPDGDEILYVISGRLRVTGDSEPHAALELGPGQGCIVPKGEWHRVSVLEPTQLVHVTPGPRGDHRPR
jgi:mannose-6-phosphate isomerase-like protein (cupin superfamily)